MSTRDIWGTSPNRLSRYFREEAGDAELTRRRWAVGLSMVGVAAGAVVSLYQVGVLRHLPDPPPGKLFDSDKVDASAYAYKRAATPDGLMMLVSYAVTALLAGAGGQNRARRAPWLAAALFGKAAFDTALAGKLAQEEWRDNKKLCAYCQTATLASAATLAVALPDAVTAAKRWLGR